MSKAYKELYQLVCGFEQPVSAFHFIDGQNRVQNKENLLRTTRSTRRVLLALTLGVHLPSTFKTPLKDFKVGASDVQIIILRLTLTHSRPFWHLLASRHHPTGHRDSARTRNREVSVGVPWSAPSPLQDLKDRSLNRSWFLTSQSIPQPPGRYGNHWPNIPESGGQATG